MRGASRTAGRRSIRVLRTVCVSLTLLATTTAAVANDQWLQWGGPDGNFKVDTDGLAKKWPDGGPKRLWCRDLGDGYSSIVCDGERLYTMYWRPGAPTPSDGSVQDETGTGDGETKGDAATGSDSGTAARRTGHEVVIALDAATGQTVWEHKYPVSWAGDMDIQFGPGPNATPLIVGDRIFTVGATVKLHCLDRRTGEKIWARDLVEEYKAGTMMYGYGASPAAYKDTIILPVGGEGQGVIAFRQADGAVAWKAQDFAPSWASPLIINVDGEDQVVVMMANGVAGLDPANGELKWKQDGHDGSCVCTPVWGTDNILFISGAYNVGTRAIKLTRQGGTTVAEELWFNKKMQIMHGNSVRVGDVVYGSSGDFGPTFIAAVDIATGDFLWRKRGFSKATCVYGDKKLIILDEDGNLALTSPLTKRLKIRSKAALCKRNSWTVPTLVGTELYVRDRHQIMALDLSAAANASTADQK